MTAEIALVVAHAEAVGVVVDVVDVEATWVVVTVDEVAAADGEVVVVAAADEMAAEVVDVAGQVSTQRRMVALLPFRAKR